jgi:hypothetical protein
MLFQDSSMLLRWTLQTNIEWKRKLEHELCIDDGIISTEASHAPKYPDLYLIDLALVETNGCYCYYLTLRIPLSFMLFRITGHGQTSWTAHLR